MKKLVILFFIFLIGISTLSAENQQKSQMITASGFPVHVGVGAGLEYMTAEANIKIKPSSTLGNIASNQNYIGKKLQFAPCVEIGTMPNDSSYFGLHFSWRHSGAVRASRSPLLGLYYFVHQFKVNSYVNAFIKPGYKLTPQVMVYGLIGPSFAKWSHKTEQFLLNDLTETSVSIDQQKTNRKSIGLGLGLGLEYFFRKKYALSVDYTYHVHRSKTESRKLTYYEDHSILGGPLISIPYSGNITKTIHPSYSTLAVRLTYFFSFP